MRRGSVIKLAAAVGVATLAMVAAVFGATGDLTAQGCIQDEDTGTDTCATTSPGLDATRSIAVSADGSSAYVASHNDDAITHFDRDATGALALVGCVDDNDAGPDDCVTSVDGLDRVRAVAISPDGRSVYTAAETDNAIVRFNRETTTGALSPAGCIEDNDSGPDGCTASTDGLSSVNSVVVSADGRSVYAVSGGDDAIVRFNRDTTTGALTAADCIHDDETGPDACANETDGLDGAQAVAISADGESVYVAATQDDAIVRFDRDTTTGAIVPAGCIDDDDPPAGPDPGCVASTDGLDGALAVAVSPDGRSVYTTSFADDAVATFNRDPSTGALTPAGCVDDNDPPRGPDNCADSTNALGGVQHVAVSTDGRTVYAAAPLDDAIARFDRNTTTGALTSSGCIDDNDSGPEVCAASVDGLNGAVWITLNDERSLYVAGEGDDAVVRFSREPFVATIPPPPPAVVPDTDPPETTMTKTPRKKTGRRKAKYRFESDEPGSTFACKLDKKPFQACSSPYKKVALRFGKHRFRVHAIDPAGNVDPTDATFGWKVRRP